MLVVSVNVGGYMYVRICICKCVCQVYFNFNDLSRPRKTAAFTIRLDRFANVYIELRVTGGACVCACMCACVFAYVSACVSMQVCFEGVVACV